MRDLRKYAKTTNFRLFVGFILLLIIVGVGLIYLIYGPGAAVTGLICVLAGLVPIVLIYFILLAIEAVAKKANDE
ncbi:MAG: hypothetical protein P8046_07560 [Anaerolineales bacterium]